MTSGPSRRPRSNTEITTQGYTTRQAASDAAFYLPHLKPGMSLLDCGCGPGTITVGLAEAVAPAQVIGIDIDEARIESAQKLAAETGATNVSFQVADVLDLPFPDESFDAAFEHAVLQHVPEPVSGAREVLRVLKRGGVFGAADVDLDGAIAGNQAMLPIPDAEIVDLYVRYRASQGANLRFGKELLGVLSEAGFSNLLLSASLSGPPRTPEDRETGLLRYATRTLNSDYSAGMVEFSEKLRDNPEMVEEYKKALESWARHPASFRIGAIYFEVVGWKA